MCTYHYVSIYLLLVFNATFNKLFCYLEAVRSWYTIAEIPSKAKVITYACSDYHWPWARIELTTLDTDWLGKNKYNYYAIAAMTTEHGVIYDMHCEQWSLSVLCNSFCQCYIDAKGKGFTLPPFMPEIGHD